MVRSHPVGVGLYYEDQKAEAAVAAKQFREQRIPKFFKYFERVLCVNSSGWVVGSELSYADLVLWHTIEGVKFSYVS